MVAKQPHSSWIDLPKAGAVIEGIEAIDALSRGEEREQLHESVMPSAKECGHLKARNREGAIFIATFLATTIFGFALSTQAHWFLWLVGQVLLALSFVQWFVTLHEAGHNTLLKSREWNVRIGHLASVFALIPFTTWKLVHGMHHKWAGWQDLDPTTAPLAPRERSRFHLAFYNTCWKFWIPIFAVQYRTGYWKLRAILRAVSDPAQRQVIVINVVVLGAIYMGLAVFVGPLALLRLLGLAWVMSLLILEPIMMSQHTHMPMSLSGGEKVKPFAAPDQIAFTRSLRFPLWFSNWVLLNFDAHELHHAFPWVPGYHLRRVPYQPPNEMPAWPWILHAHRLSAEVFMLQDRNRTGEQL